MSEANRWLEDQYEAVCHERDEWRKRCHREIAASAILLQERNEARALAERYQVEQDDALGRLADLQRSIASALFGEARDDSRVPTSRISGEMIDALETTREVFVCHSMTAVMRAEAFLAEEDRHGR